MDKPSNPACLRNQGPIYEALQPYLSAPGELLELASGTGQHGVYVASRTPHVTWQLSERPDQIQLSHMWWLEANLKNLKAALPLDVDETWAVADHHYQYGYLANLLHFVSEDTARNVFAGFNHKLANNGLLFCYGPINENGFTSEGNQALDEWLKHDVNPQAGIKELEWIVSTANGEGFELLERLNLPANNVILIFKKEA